MTGSTEGAAAPPKKRSFFKQAAWQTAKADGEKERDIFSHSSEYNDILAEEARRKVEEKRKGEVVRKQKAEAVESERKRRKTSIELDVPQASQSGSSSTVRVGRTRSRPRSRTPISPAPMKPAPESLAARYDSLTKSSSSTDSLLPKIQNEVIDLESDSDADYTLNQSSLEPRYASNATTHIASTRAVGRTPSEEVEEVEDPMLAALAAKARARAATSQSTSAKSLPEANKKSAVVELLIHSDIENAKPLRIKVRSNTPIATPRDAWCKKQNFPPDMAQNVFFTWRMKRLFGSTRIDRLGVQVDDTGNVSVEGDTNLYDQDNLPKIYLEAWTEDLYRQRQREDAEEAAAKKKAAEVPAFIEEEPMQETEPEAQKLRLILKAKGREDFKIAVNPDTTFSHLAHAYKEKREVPSDQPVTFMFDGARLKPMDTIVDADIEDMDIIEVLFK